MPGEKNNVVGTLLLGFCTALSFGCAKESSESCSTARIIRNPFDSNLNTASRSSLFQTVQQAQMLGGYLDIGDSRCTATFDFRDYNEKYFEVGAWTARHCSSEKINAGSIAKMQLFLGDGYSQIIAIDDLALRRQRVQELGRAAGLGPDAQEALDNSFRFVLGNQKNKQDTGCYNPEGAHEARKDGQVGICANTEDLGRYRLFALKSDLKPYQMSLIRSSITRVANGRKLLASASSGVDLNKWSDAAAEVWRVQHQKHYASVLERIHNTCTGTNPPVTAGSCSKVAEILKIADAQLVEDQIGIVTLATKQGFWNASTRTLIQVKGTSLAESLKQQEGDLRAVIAQNWSSYGAELLSKPDTLWMNFNITQSSDAKNMPNSYASVPVQSLFGMTTEMEKTAHQPNGIQLLEKKERANVQFDFTDSGAAIAAYGVFPVLALSGRCNETSCEQTSGGVAVTPLPEASGRTPERPSRLVNDQTYDSGRVINGSDGGDCP
jgi:hypothetical protein